jgi:dTMP kinase
LKGRFITLEGGEGAGKSTQARLLAAALAQAGHPVLRTREPGGAPGAEALRAMLLAGEYQWSAAAEAHLHFAARAEHLAQTILPALAAGLSVVCDRFADSTLAYQGYGQGADRELIAGLTELLPRVPDLTIMLRVSPAVAEARIAGRQQRLDRYEVMDAAFHARVAAGFATIAAAASARCRVVDADGSVESVHAAIFAAVLTTVQ